MSEDKISISLEEAKNRLPSGTIVHTYRQSGYMIIGADWEKRELLRVMKKYKIRETGGMAKRMDHGLAILDDRGWLFIATKKLTEIEEKEEEGGK